MPDANPPDYDATQRDLELASLVQARMTPESLPRLDRYALFARTTPVTWGNGDFYDALPVRPRSTEAGYVHDFGPAVDQVVFLLGDATGHGVASALVATDLRAMIRMSIRMGVYHRVLLRSLNEQLALDLLPDHFVTLWMGRLHVSENMIRGVSLGQAPFFFYHAARGECVAHQAHCPPLGIGASLEGYEPDVYRFEPGDSLILLTDGYFETVNAEGAAFGTERVRETLAAAGSGSPEEIHQALWGAIDRFSGGAPLADDRTAVIIQRRE